jgi:hypothetical protein
MKATAPPIQFQKGSDDEPTPYARRHSNRA